MGSVTKNIMPCAACKLLHRRCTSDCIFLPYFPPTEAHKFAAVHRIFGASNISKMLQEIPEDNRRDAVTSMVYEAEARLKDPVYGCVALITSLQSQVFQLQSELSTVLTEATTLRARMSEALSTLVCFEGSQSTDDRPITFHDDHDQNYDALSLLPCVIDSAQTNEIALPPESW